MMEFGMPSIAGVLMALLVHKGLPEHKGLQGPLEQLERKDQLGHKVPWVLQDHKDLRGLAGDSTVGI
jgi:hypothetical protein